MKLNNLHKKLKVIYQFYKKDFLLASSYKINFIFSIISSVFMIFILFNISKITSLKFDDAAGNSFGYFIIGYIFLDMAMTISSRGASEIRSMQLSGIFEEIILHVKNPITVAISTFIYPIILSILRFFAIIVIATLVFGLTINMQSYWYLVLTISFSIIGFVGIGLISSSVIVLLKKGDFVNIINFFFSAGFGGVFFPISLVGENFQTLSNALPITHALEISRTLLLDIENISHNLNSIISLITVSSLIILIGVLSFNYVIKIEKQNGSLGHL